MGDIKHDLMLLFLLVIIFRIESNSWFFGTVSLIWAGICLYKLIEGEYFAQKVHNTQGTKKRTRRKR